MHGSPAGSVRSLERRDIPRICQLFFTTFRSGTGHRTDKLANAIEATYLTSPAYGRDRGSIVHVDAEGRVDGFMGVINLTLMMGERRLNAGILSAYMAENPVANPAIGVSLVRAVLNRGLDVVFSDTANQRSLEMSRALRFSVLPLQSLEWVKVLRPIGTGAYFLRRKRFPPARWLGSAVAAIDGLTATGGLARSNQRCIEGSTDGEATVADFVAGAPAFLEPYAVRPAWDRGELDWVLGRAALQTRSGPLHIREVLDRSGRRAGLYLLYGQRGGTAVALQILATRGREDVVVGNLIRYAAGLGAVCVRGAASCEAVQGLLHQPGIFYHQVMNTVVWVRDREVAALVRSGDVFLGGLAGETWAQIFADPFS